MQWVIFMQEVNELAARVWKRVASGEAYAKPRVQPHHSRKKAASGDQSQMLAICFLLLVFCACGREFTPKK